jgi:hypothetical protein
MTVPFGFTTGLRGGPPRHRVRRCTAMLEPPIAAGRCGRQRSSPLSRVCALGAPAFGSNRLPLPSSPHGPYIATLRESVNLLCRKLRSLHGSFARNQRIAEPSAGAVSGNSTRHGCARSELPRPAVRSRYESGTASDPPGRRGKRGASVFASAYPSRNAAKWLACQRGNGVRSSTFTTRGHDTSDSRSPRSQRTQPRSG